jgi:hypothetical protein
MGRRSVWVSLLIYPVKKVVSNFTFCFGCRRGTLCHKSIDVCISQNLLVFAAPELDKGYLERIHGRGFDLIGI